MYKFKYDILQCGHGISFGEIYLDLTETEVLFVYVAYRSEDSLFKAKALKSVEAKAKHALDKLWLRRIPGPPITCIARLDRDLSMNLIMDAKRNPLKDTLQHFLDTAGALESMVFYDGVREYCDKIIKEIK